MSKYSALLVLVLLFSCKGVSQWVPAGPGKIIQIEAPPVVRAHTPAPVQVTVSLPNGCYRVEKVTVTPTESVYYLEAYLQACSDCICSQVLTAQTVSIHLTFPSPGIYRIQAFSSDTVADTVRVIP